MLAHCSPAETTPSKVIGSAILVTVYMGKQKSSDLFTVMIVHNSMAMDDEVINSLCSVSARLRARHLMTWPKPFQPY